MTSSPVDRLPTLRWLAWKMAKAAIRRPSRIPHMASSVRGAIRNRKVLRQKGADDGPVTLIALIEHMGDIIAAEPVSRYAARRFPGDPVTWVCREPYRPAVAAFPAVDRIITVGCMTEWFLLWTTQRRRDRTWDLHISRRICPVCGIALEKSGAAGNITYDTYYTHGNLLKVNCLVADIPVLEEAPRFLPDAAAVEVVDKLGLPDQFVVIHCKSNEDGRDWEPQKWHDLVKWLIEQTGMSVCEVGSSPVVITRDTARIRSLCGMLSLPQSAEVIARATLFIGVDSGPAHLANAAGTPGVILLGRYHVFDSYTPYSGGYGDGSKADIVRVVGRLAREIPVEDVIAAASRRLPSAATPDAVGQGVSAR